MCRCWQLELCGRTLREVCFSIQQDGEPQDTHFSCRVGEIMVRQWKHIVFSVLSILDVLESQIRAGVCTLTQQNISLAVPKTTHWVCAAFSTSTRMSHLIFYPFMQLNKLALIFYILLRAGLAVRFNFYYYCCYYPLFKLEESLRLPSFTIMSSFQQVKRKILKMKQKQNKILMMLNHEACEVSSDAITMMMALFAINRKLL